MSTALIERCKGRWHDVLVAVGVPASALTGKHASCPACGGKDRFRFDDKGGSVRGDNQGEIQRQSG